MNIILPFASSDKDKVSEIIAVALLNLANKNDLSGFQMLRSSDPAVYTSNDITTQVTILGQGHIYDPDRSRFDYHQEGFNHKYYAVASTYLGLSGMIWLKYGPTIIRDMIEQVGSADIDGICLYIYQKLFEDIDAQDNHIPSLLTKTCFDWLNYADLSINVDFAEYLNITCRYLEKHIPNLYKRYLLEVDESAYFAKLAPNGNYCMMDRHLVTLDELDPLCSITMVIETHENTYKVLARDSSRIPFEQTLKSMMPNPTELISVNRFQDQAVTTTLESAKFIVEATLASYKPIMTREDTSIANFAAFTETLRALQTSQDENVRLRDEIKALHEKIMSISTQYREASRRRNDVLGLLGDLRVIAEKVKEFDLGEDEPKVSLKQRLVTGYKRIGVSGTVKRVTGLVAGVAALGGLYWLTRNNDE